MRASLALLLLATPAGGASAADLALSRATLSSSGVGQFEYAADIDGPTTLTLDVPLADVDDVLKSLRVADPAGPAAIRLAGREPLEETFRTLPFQQSALASDAALLAALVGVQVRLPEAGATGTILSVAEQTQTLPENAGTLARHRLTIATANGIETVTLEDTPAIEFTSEPLRRQIAAALAAIAAHGAQDRRSIEVALSGAGHRRVTLTDVVAVPVWKSSYRLVLAADANGAEGHARLEGDAVVENLTGRDWKDVDLTLTSGQPVLYRQSLYDAFFAQRPEAPVDVPPTVTPRITTSIEAAVAVVPPPPPSPAPKQERRAFSAGAMTASAVQAKPASAEAEQTATQVNFHLAAPISAAAGQTLLLPFLARDIKASRVTLIEPDQGAKPLVALLLANDTGAAWPPGLSTLYGPEGFIGDARLPAVQPGQSQMAVFAADLPVTVDATHDGATDTIGVKAVNGVLTLTRRQTDATTYTVKAPASGGRTVVIDQPRRSGWELAEPKDNVVTTPDSWRITLPVAAGAKATVRVALQRPDTETVVIGDQAPEQLAAISATGALTPAQHAALAHIADLRAQQEKQRVTDKDLSDKQQAIVSDQDRVRKNLAAVPSNSELQRGYLSQLQTQEHDLATLRTQQDSLRTQRADTDAKLHDAIATLTF